MGWNHIKCFNKKGSTEHIWSCHLYEISLKSDFCIFASQQANVHRAGSGTELGRFPLTTRKPVIGQALVVGGCRGGWSVKNKHKSSSTIYFPSYSFTGDISKWSLPFLSMAALIHQFHRELYPRSMAFTTTEHLSMGGRRSGRVSRVCQHVLWSYMDGWIDEHTNNGYRGQGFFQP